MLGAVLLVGTAGCTEEGGQADAATVDALTDVRWSIVSYIDGDGIVAVDPAGDDATITFEANGRVSGDDGCNGFSGSFEADGSKLTFGPLAGTQMACTGPADEVSRKVTAALFKKLLAEELAKVKDAGAEGKLDEAARLFEQITADDHYVEFLTLPAYQLID